jgi:hypothetical protein
MLTPEKGRELVAFSFEIYNYEMKTNHPDIPWIEAIFIANRAKVGAEVLLGPAGQHIARSRECRRLAGFSELAFASGVKTVDRIVAVQALEGYRLQITLADGTRGEVWLVDWLFGPVFEPLTDVAQFQRVFVDEFGAVCWPNGADLAPDAPCERIRTASHVA